MPGTESYWHWAAWMVSANRNSLHYALGLLPRHGRGIGCTQSTIKDGTLGYRDTDPLHTTPRNIMLLVRCFLVRIFPSLWCKRHMHPAVRCIFWFSMYSSLWYMMHVPSVSIGPLLLPSQRIAPLFSVESWKAIDAVPFDGCCQYSYGASMRLWVQNFHRPCTMILQELSSVATFRPHQH